MLFRSAIVMALFFSSAHAAQSTDITSNVVETLPQATHPNWALQITPYVWAAGLDGDISPFRRSPTIGVEKSFSDVMADLNVGGFMNVFGRYDRFVLSGDMMYVNTIDSRRAGPLPARPIPGVGMMPPGSHVDAKVNTKQFTATLMGGYQVINTPQIALDVLGGARIWHISNDVTLTGTIGSMSRSGRYVERFGWVDPLVGLRTFVPVTQKLSFQGQADIGGFGVGSDLTWSVLATANYVFSDHLSASAGYKVINVDYARRGHVYNTRLSGPVLGITYRF